jgi:hypothetical protein
MGLITKIDVDRKTLTCNGALELHLRAKMAYMRQGRQGETEVEEKGHCLNLDHHSTQLACSMSLFNWYQRLDYLGTITRAQERPDNSKQYRGR